MYRVTSDNRPAEATGRVSPPPPTRRRLAAALGGALPVRGQRIGLLGGSFNPAHGGHRFISLEALKRLRLDSVWWLVSPQNPLKPRTGMAPLEARYASARAEIAGHPRLRATTVEEVLGTFYTRETLAALRDRFPGVRFVWLMGADNLWQVDRWAEWSRIFHTVPVAVFNRPSYSQSAGFAKAARRFDRARIAERDAARLADAAPPAWVFLHQPQDPRSATEIRARRERDTNAR